MALVSLNNSFEQNRKILEENAKKLNASKTGLSTSGDSAAPQPVIAEPTVDTGSAAQQQTSQPEPKVDSKNPWAAGWNALTDSDEEKGTNDFNAFLLGTTDPNSKTFNGGYVTATNVNAITAWSSSIPGLEVNAETGIPREAVDEYIGIYWGADSTLGYNTTKLKLWDDDTEVETITAPGKLKSKPTQAERAAWNAQNNAYQFQNNVLKPEITTRKAEDEYAKLKKEIEYKVGRTDVNYSDEDIIRGIDWTDYPTLDEMRKAAARGRPIALNRPVDYSDTTLTGLCWAARNPELSTGNAMLDSIKAAGGIGKQWQYIDSINRYTNPDPDNPDYMPYKVVGTLADKYGVNSINGAWLTEHEDELTESEAKRISGLINKTEEAQKTAEALKEYVKYCAKNDIEIDFHNPNAENYILKNSTISYTPDGSLDDVSLNVSFLKQLNDSVQVVDGYRSSKGVGLMDTTAPIDFSVSDLETIYNGTKNSSEQFEKDFADLFGDVAGHTASDMNNRQMAAAVNKFHDILLTSNDPNDRELQKLMGTQTDLDPRIDFVKKFVESGALTQEEAVQLIYRAAEDFTSDNYASNAWIVNQYDSAKTIYDKALEQMQKDGLVYDENWETSFGDEFEGQVSGWAELAGYGKPHENRGAYETPQGVAKGSTQDTAYRMAYESRLKYETPEGVAKGSVEDKLYYLDWVSGLSAKDQRSLFQSDQAWYKFGDALAAGNDNKYLFGGAAPEDYTGETWTIKDMIPAYKKDTMEAGYYSVIRRAKKQMDHYAEAEADARGMLEKIDRMTEEAVRYGVGVYGTPEYYEDGTANLSGSINSFGVDRVDYIRRATDAILSFGGKDYEPQAGMYAAQYNMMLRGYTDWSDQQVAAMLNKDPSQITDLDRQLAAMMYLNNQLEELKGWKESIESIDRVVDIYGINVGDFDVMEGQENSPAENYEAFKTDIDDAIFQLEWFQKEQKDQYADREVNALVSQLSSDTFGTSTEVVLARYLAGKITWGEAASFFGNFVTANGTQYINELSGRVYGAETYMYIYAKAGKEEADKYWNMITGPGGSALIESQMNVRQTAQDIANSGFWGAAGGSAATIMLSLGQVQGTLYSIGQKLRGKPIDSYSGAFSTSAFNTTFRGTVHENIAQYSEALALAYDSAMSGGDSVVNGIISGGLGLTGLTELGVTKAGTILAHVFGGLASSSVMGLEAAGTAIWNARLKGADSDTALLMGAITFAAETSTEAITVNNLLSAYHSGEMEFASVKNTLEGFLESVAGDWWQEAGGESINEIAETWAEWLVMKDNSDYGIAVQKYIDMGYPKDVAEQKAFRDSANDVLLAGISGALMSIGTSGGSFLAGSMKTALGKAKYGTETYMDMVYRADEKRAEDNIKDITKRMKAAETEMNKHNTRHNRAVYEGYQRQLRGAERVQADLWSKKSGIMSARMDSFADSVAETNKDIRTMENDLARPVEAPGYRGTDLAEPTAPTQPLTPEQNEARLNQRSEDNAKAEQEAIDAANENRTKQKQEADVALRDAYVAEQEEAHRAVFEAQEKHHQERIAEAEASGSQKRIDKANDNYAKFKKWVDKQRAAWAKEAETADYSSTPALADAKKQHDIAYQEADTAYEAAIAKAVGDRKSADEAAMQEAYSEDQKWKQWEAEQNQQTREQLQQEAVDKKNQSAKAEAEAIAAADKAREDGLKSVTEKTDKLLAAAEATRLKTVQNAEAKRAKDIARANALTDEEAKAKAIAKANKTADSVIKGANTKYNHSVDEINATADQALTNLDTDHEAALLKAWEDRMNADAETDRAYQEGLAKLPDITEPISIPAEPISEGEAANDIQGVTEQIFEVLDALQSRLDAGDTEGVEESKNGLNGLGEALGNGIKKLKASIQQRIEQGGVGMTYDDFAKIKSADRMMRRIKIVMSILEGKPVSQEELNAAGAPVNAATAPAGEPAGKTAYDPKTMYLPFRLDKSGQDRLGIPGDFMYATYMGQPGRFYGGPSGRSGGVFVPLNVNVNDIANKSALKKTPGVKQFGASVLQPAGLDLYRNSSEAAVNIFNGKVPGAENVVGNDAATAAGIAPHVDASPVGAPVNENGEQATPEVTTGGTTGAAPVPAETGEGVPTGERPGAVPPAPVEGAVGEQPTPTEGTNSPAETGVGEAPAPNAEGEGVPTGTEPTGETGTTPDIKELFDWIRDGANAMLDNIRNALDMGRANQQGKEHTQSEIDLRAAFVDAYNGVKAALERVQHFYDEYLKAQASNDTSSEDAAYKALERAYGQLKDEWANYYIARLDMRNGLTKPTPNAMGKDAANPYLMASAALNKADGSENTTVKFTAVAGVVSGSRYSSDRTTSAVAGAATQSMFTAFGTDNTIQGLQHAIANAYANGVDITALKNTVKTLALTGDQGMGVLRQLFNGQISAAEAVDMANKMTTDTESAKIMKRRVEDYQRGVEYRKLVAAGGLDSLAGPKANLEHANAAVEKAQTELDNKVQERDNRYNELQDAQAEYDNAMAASSTMADRDSKGVSGKTKALSDAANRVNAAAQAYGNAVSVVAEYRQTLNNARQAQASAQRAYTDAANKAVMQLKAQAAQNVAQFNAENDAAVNAEIEAMNAQAALEAQQAEAAAREAADALKAEADKASAKADERAEEVETERENSNADNMERRGFVDRFYPDATEEQKRHIEERIEAQQKEKTDRDKVAARKRFIKRLGEMFGVKFKIVDTTEGGTKLRSEGYYDSKNGIVYLDRQTTQGEAIYRVALHELTHALERTGNYERFAQILLDAEYGTDTDRLNDDIRNKQRTYNEWLRKMGKDPLTPEGAKKEIVADLTRKLLYGDQAAIENLIAEDVETAKTVWQSIKDFLKKLVGIQDPVLTGLDEARKLFEEGLKEAGVPIDESGDVRYSLQESNDALKEYGIEIDADSGAAVQYSVRTAPQTEAERNDAVNRLLNSGRGFTEEESRAWVNSQSTVSTIILQNMLALDYQSDSRYSWLKKNSDYTQGSADFNTNCPKRTQFTAIFDRLQQALPNRVFTAQDYEAIRQKLIERGVTVTCGPCFVEDRRQHTGEIAQGFVDQLKDGTLKPKFRSMIGNDAYIPTQYDLVTYGGLRKLYDSHRGIHNAFIAFNNARGMQSARLVEGMAEYNNQIKKWNKAIIASKNSKGGLRIFSLSDADPRTMIDIIQIVLDAAEKGLMIQGYTKKPWFARMIKDTGVRILRSHIPKGNGIQNGQIWYDDVEGINRFDKNYKDADGIDVAESSPNIGDNIIGINDDMIRLAMKTREIDQIIPFHSSLANEIRNKKKIGDWQNYKNDQTEKDISTGNVADKQINIYKDVINAWAAKGTPIKNKVEFVNAFLQVCKDRNLIPRFDRFLDKVDGEYVYTEGYEKFLVDYKLFDRNTGEIIPQAPVRAVFDDRFNRQVLEDYVKGVSEVVPASEEVVQEVLDMFGGGDTQYSLPVTPEMDAEYMQAVADEDEMKQAEILNRAAKEAGYVNAGFHGTLNGGFTVFDRRYSHVGGNSGAGFYFSDSLTDSTENYSDVEGADNYFKAQHLAEQISEYLADTGETEYDGIEINDPSDPDELLAVAKQLITKKPQVYGAYLDLGKSYVRDFNNSTNLYDSIMADFDESSVVRSDYDSDEAYEDDLFQRQAEHLQETIGHAVYHAIDDVDSMHEIVSGEVDTDAIISSLVETAMDYQNLTWNDILRAVSDQYIEVDVGETESADASTEVTRAIIENLGFDSITDKEASRKFNQIKGTGTTHYIMFRPEQIKSADLVTRYNNGNIIKPSERFNRKNPDIRYSLPSDDILDEQIAAYLSGELGDFGEAPEAPARSTPANAAEAFNTEFSSVGMAYDPSKTEATGSSEPVQSGTRIITDWLDKIGMKYETSRRRYERSLRGNTLGYTQRGSGIIHVWDTSNMEVAWHEIGHVFDSKFGLRENTQTQHMIDEMRKDRYWALWFDQYSDEEKPGEAIAEAIGLWLADRDGAIKVCGEEFINHLEKCIDDAGWTKATMEMKEAWRRNREANSVGRAMGYVQLMANPESIRSIARNWKEILFDHTNPLYRIADKLQNANMYSADKDVRILEKLRDRRAGNTMNAFINLGITLPGTDALMLDKDGKRYEALGELLGRIKKEDIQAFNTYMLLEHAVDRQLTNVDFDKIEDAEEMQRMMDRIREVFGNDVDVNAALAKMKKDHPEFEKIGNRLREIYNAVVKAWAVDTGLMDRKTFYRFRNRWPHYVPTYRVGESQHNPQAAVTGSTKDIYNPIASLVENMNRYVSDYYNQEVLRAFDDFMMTPGVDHMGIAEQTEVHSGADVVKVKLEDGTERYWAIKDDSILRALTYTRSSSVVPFMKAIGKVGNLTRFLAATSTAWSLGFAIQNFMSDTETALVTGNSAVTIFDYGVHLLKSAAILLRNQNKGIDQMADVVRYYKMYAEMGSKYAYRNKAGVKELHRELYDNEAKGVKKALDALKHPISTIEDITGFFEDLTRFNEFRMAGEERTAFMKKLLGKNYQRADLSTEAGRLSAARQAADVTTDFGQSGSSNLLTDIARLVPFFNASMQGMYKTMRMFSKDNAGRRIFTGTKLLINSIIMGAAVAALRGRRWKKDEKEAYEQLNYYERAQYYHIKIGDGKFLRFRRSQDAFIGLGSIFGEMIGSITSGLEDDPFSVFVNVGQQVVQNALVDPKSNIVSPLVDAYFNKTWSGGNVENSRMLDMNMLDRYEAAEGTSALYRSLSALASMLPIVKDFEYSPADMKYIIGQYTGTFGTIGTGLIDNLVGMMTGSYNKGFVSAIWEPVKDKIIKKFSVDPLYSNRITSDYKDAAAFIQGIPAAVDAGERTAVLRMDLSEQEYKAAVDEARKLTDKKNGKLTKMSKAISDEWTSYYKTLNNTKLPDGEREIQAQKHREKINDLSMQYTALVNQYRVNYGYTTEFLQGAAGTILPYAENLIPGTNKKKPK